MLLQGEEKADSLATGAGEMSRRKKGEWDGRRDDSNSRKQNMISKKTMNRTARTFTA